MNWTNDSTGCNDTGTELDDGIDSSARAACERVERRMASQRERQTEPAKKGAAALPEMDTVAEAARATSMMPPKPRAGWSEGKALLVVVLGIWIFGWIGTWFPVLQGAADAATVGLAIGAALMWYERRRAEAAWESQRRQADAQASPVPISAGTEGASMLGPLVRIAFTLLGGVVAFAAGMKAAGGTAAAHRDADRLKASWEGRGNRPWKG
jgi:hypothetical protein